MNITVVNKALAPLGDIKLVKGDGYFYFIGEAVSLDASGVYVYSLKELTLSRWIEEAQAAMQSFVC
jgi:hypothetical protein